MYILFQTWMDQENKPIFALFHNKWSHGLTSSNKIDAVADLHNCSGITDLHNVQIASFFSAAERGKIYLFYIIMLQHTALFCTQALL
ncbi:hypothetical protein ACJX0J_010365, partial [Zea mays]